MAAQRRVVGPVIDDGRTRVWRTRDPDLGVIIHKEALDEEALERIAHEASVLRRLDAVVGVPRLRPSFDPRVLVVVGSGERSLAEVLCDRRMSPAEVVAVGQGLARTLGAVHEAGVAHLGLHPGNVLLTGDGGVELVDFDLATMTVEVRPGFTHHREILGPLPYMSPEQTGRTGSAVDRRSDLYAVGALLYEAATGRPPFIGPDPVELVRDILTREPTPMVQLDPALPPALDVVVARLLEKDPDRRYQSAAGLAHDLARVAADPMAAIVPGERDFPSRLAAPTRLVGRDADIAVLAAALHAVVDPTSRTTSRLLAGRVLLVSGGPGVGKSSLVDMLRPLVAGFGGWFVSGKADQVVADSSGGLRWALRGLARLLLAEAPTTLDVLARDLRQRLRSNAAFLVAVAPEFSQVLGGPAVAADPDGRELEDRVRQAVVDLLRAVASPARPVVLFLDDLQWTPPGDLAILDAIVNDPVVDGLLVVGAYRDTDTGARPAAMAAGWARLGVEPTTLHLAPLGRDDLTTLLGHVLRLPPERAAALAGVIGDRTGGNPFDTVELLNSLREAGSLVLGDDGWTWDVAAIEHHVGGDVVALLTARIENLGPAAARLLDAMACLGADVSGTDLAVACGVTVERLTAHLTQALEAGLVTLMRRGRPTADIARGRLGFRHDRVQQAAFERLGARGRRRIQARMGWRLAAAGRDLHAARQLLAAGVRPRDPDRQRLVIRLYRAAADHERRRADFTATEQFLAAAALILLEVPTTAAAREHLVVESERHHVLYQLGRLDEADAVYQSLCGSSLDTIELAQVTAIQVAILTNRHQSLAAVELGLGVLSRMGVAYPEDDAEAEVSRGLAEVMAWAKGLDAAADARRPALTDPTAAALAAVMARLSPPAYFSTPLVSAWLVIQAKRLWEEHGPSSDLVGVLGHGPVAFVAIHEEFRAGEVLLTYLIAVGEAHLWERATGNARFLYAVSTAHWFEPLDACVEAARRACDALLHVGDLAQACWAYFPLAVDTFETAPRLDESVTALSAALALAGRTGILPVLHCLWIVRRFCDRARGHADGGSDHLASAATDQTVEALADVVPIIGVYLRLYRSIAAALAGDREQLAANSRMAHQQAQHIPGIVITLITPVPFGLELCLELRDVPPGGSEHTALLAELDELVAWLRQRAQDQPDNAAHLVSYLEAERAWALGDLSGAVSAFDAALSAVQRTSRPWHHALLARRAGELHHELGLDHLARLHLAEAWQALADWGADAMAAEFERTYPFLRDQMMRPGAVPARTSPMSSRTTFSTETIDTTAILRVAQALAAQTTMTQLHGVIVEQLRAITGATAVHIVLHDESTGWRIYRARTDAVGDIALDDPGAAALLPVSAVRYVRRTHEPLVVDDATTDDRFARDPYLIGERQLALLVLPVLRAGDLRAVLVLENRLSYGAFTRDRLGFVNMLTGQLAVALDNAQVYASLERRIAERTAALRSANEQLELLSTTDALTGVANRRRFDAALAAEWARSSATALPVSVIMIDVDHFKKYNDHLGHPAGDTCLVEISRLLADSLRNNDLLCRYGGEEFAAILPRADLSTAAVVAERMRVAVQDARLPHIPDIGTVTVSIGVTSSLASATAPHNDLVPTADAALYEAKRAGRNRVRTRVWSAEPPAVAQIHADDVGVPVSHRAEVPEQPAINSE